MTRGKENNKTDRNVGYFLVVGWLLILISILSFDIPFSAKMFILGFYFIITAVIKGVNI